jgi:hypothetical protein
MPPVQFAAAPAAEERPIPQAGSNTGANTVAPAKPAPAKPIVPVHPRKQARH